MSKERLERLRMARAERVKRRLVGAVLGRKDEGDRPPVETDRAGFPVRELTPIKREELPD